LDRQRPDAEKTLAYECGFEAFEDSRMKFDVRYYLSRSWSSFSISRSRSCSRGRYRSRSGSFRYRLDAGILTILVVGFVYEWKKGALEWD